MPAGRGRQRACAAAQAPSHAAEAAVPREAAPAEAGAQGAPEGQTRLAAEVGQCLLGSTSDGPVETGACPAEGGAYPAAEPGADAAAARVLAVREGLEGAAPVAQVQPAAAAAEQLPAGPAGPPLLLLPGEEGGSHRPAAALPEATDDAGAARVLAVREGFEEGAAPVAQVHPAAPIEAPPPELPMGGSGAPGPCHAAASGRLCQHVTPDAAGRPGGYASGGSAGRGE